MWGRTVFWFFIFGTVGSVFWYVQAKDVPTDERNSGPVHSRDLTVHPGLNTGAEEPSHSGLVSPEVEAVLGRIHKARERLEKDPKDKEALIILGNANYDIHRYDRAKEYYLAALEQDPENIHVRTDLASCYRILGDAARAVQELETALRIDPTHGTALYNLGVIYLNDLGNMEDAIRAWETFVKWNPQDPMAEGIREKIQELKK